MTRSTIFIAAGLALAAVLPAMPAQALVARTFLSAAGSDSNNCANVATPCRHLAAAYAATAPNGEIYVLDPANYGSLTITGPVSIEGHGWASIAPVANNAAITINATTSDKINIIGVVLDGTNISGTNGIVFNSGGSLTVQDSVIRNFRNAGILIQQNSTGPSPIQFSISNTLVSDNFGDGIDIFPTGGFGGSTNCVFDHVKMQNNGDDGLNVQTAQLIDITVTDSVIANNGEAGITALALSGDQINIMVRNSTIANNRSIGLNAQSALASIRVTRSTITGNFIGWEQNGGGIVTSYGDNNIEDNGSANNAPTQIVYK